MKTCSLDDFMAEMQPWLDTEYLRNAHLNEQGHFVLQFQDGMQKIYNIDDCNLEHVRQILKDLAARGISTTS